MMFNPVKALRNVLIRKGWIQLKYTLVIANERTRSGRVYTEEVIDRALKDAPDGSGKIIPCYLGSNDTKLTSLCGMVSLSREGDKVVGKMAINDTTYGQAVKELITQDSPKDYHLELEGYGEIDADGKVTQYEPTHANFMWGPDGIVR